MESMEQDKKFKFNQSNIYREDVFSDLTTGTIRQLTPVKQNGEIDKGRKLLFLGQSQIYTPQGPLPIQFPIDAETLQQAMDSFPQAMEAYVAHLVEEAEKAQRETQSRIIVPGGSAAGGSGIITP